MFTLTATSWAGSPVSITVDDVAPSTAVGTDGRLGLGRGWRGLWRLLGCRGRIRCRDCSRGPWSLEVDLCRICGQSRQYGEQPLPHASPSLSVVEDSVAVGVNASVDDVLLL